MNGATSKETTSVFRGKQMYKRSEFRLLIENLHKALQGRLPPNYDVLILAETLVEIRYILYLPAHRRCTTDVLRLHNVTSKLGLIMTTDTKEQS